jgi:hypothetical protein
VSLVANRQYQIMDSAFISNITEPPFSFGGDQQGVFGCTFSPQDWWNFSIPIFFRLSIVLSSFPKAAIPHAKLSRTRTATSGWFAEWPLSGKVGQERTLIQLLGWQN